jgi:hypothetical protein
MSVYTHSGKANHEALGAPSEDSSEQRVITLLQTKPFYTVGTMDATRVTLCRSNTDCAIGVAEGVVVACWLHNTNIEDVEELGRAVRRAQSGPNELVKLVQVVPQTAVTPDARVRSALARMLRGLQGLVSHSAIVFEGHGFRAAMVRSIVTSITSLSNPGFPHRVFAKLPQAAAWMYDDSAVLSARQLEDVAQRVRAAVVRSDVLEQRAKERSAAAHYR